VTKKFGGQAVCCKTGHAFMKERMRSEDAIYGGEMSAHHYFKDFFYCDSGMIPWILVIQMMADQDKSLSELVNQYMTAFPASGEINTAVEDPEGLIQKIKARYQSSAEAIDNIDGLSMSFKDWRFNLRMSNTEPVIRLNVESRGNANLMNEKKEELLKHISGS